MVIAADGAGSSLELAQRRALGMQITGNVVAGNQAAAGAQYVDAQQQAYIAGGGPGYGDPNTTSGGKIVGPTQSYISEQQAAEMAAYAEKRRNEQAFTNTLTTATQAYMNPQSPQGSTAGGFRSTPQEGRMGGSAAAVALADMNAGAFAANLSAAYRTWGESMGLAPDKDGGYDYVPYVYTQIAGIEGQVPQQGATFFGKPDGTSFYVPGKVADGLTLEDEAGNQITAEGGVYYTAEQLRQDMVNQLLEPFMTHGTEAVQLNNIREDMIASKNAELKQLGMQLAGDPFAQEQAAALGVGALSSQVQAEVEEELLQHVKAHPQTFPKTAARLEREAEFDAARRKVLDAAMGGYSNPFQFTPTEGLFEIFQRTYQALPAEWRDDLVRELGTLFSPEDASRVIYAYLTTVVGDQQTYRAGDLGLLQDIDEYSFRGLENQWGDISQSRRLTDEEYEEVAQILEDLPNKPMNFARLATHPTTLAILGSLVLAPATGMLATSLLGMRLAAATGISARAASFFFARGAQSGAYSLATRAAGAGVGAAVGGGGFALAGEDPLVGAGIGAVAGAVAAPVLISRVAPFLLQGFAAKSHSGRLAWFDSAQGLVSSASAAEAGLVLGDAAQMKITGEQLLSSSDMPITMLVDMPARYLAEAMVMAGMPKGTATWVGYGLEALFWMSPTVALEGAAKFSSRALVGFSAEEARVATRAFALMGSLNMSDVLHNGGLFGSFMDRVQQAVRIGLSPDDAAVFAAGDLPIGEFRGLDDAALAGALREAGYTGKPVVRGGGSDEDVIAEAMGDYIEFAKFDRTYSGAAYDSRAQSVAKVSTLDPTTRDALEAHYVRQSKLVSEPDPGSEARIAGLDPEIEKQLRFRANEIDATGQAVVGKGWADPLDAGTHKGLVMEQILQSGPVGRMGASEGPIPLAPELDEFGNVVDVSVKPPETAGMQQRSVPTGRWQPETMDGAGNRLGEPEQLERDGVKYMGRKVQYAGRLDPTAGKGPTAYTEHPIHWKPQTLDERAQVTTVVQVAGFRNVDEAVTGYMEARLARELGAGPGVRAALHDGRWSRLSAGVRIYLQREADDRLAGGALAGISKQDLLKSAKRIRAISRGMKRGAMRSASDAELSEALNRQVSANLRRKQARVESAKNLTKAQKAEMAATRELGADVPNEKEVAALVRKLKKAGFEGSSLGETRGGTGTATEFRRTGNVYESAEDFDAGYYLEDAALALSDGELRIGKRPQPGFASGEERAIAQFYFEGEVRGGKSRTLSLSQQERLAMYAEGWVPDAEQPMARYTLDNMTYQQSIARHGYEPSTSGEVELMDEYKAYLFPYVGDVPEVPARLQSVLNDPEMRRVVESRYRHWLGTAEGWTNQYDDDWRNMVQGGAKRNPMGELADEADVMRERAPRGALQEVFDAANEAGQPFEDTLEILAQLILWKRPFRSAADEIEFLEGYVRRLETAADDGTPQAVATIEGYQRRIEALKTNPEMAFQGGAMDPALLDSRLVPFMTRETAPLNVDLSKVTPEELTMLGVANDQVTKARAALALFVADNVDPDSVEVKALTDAIDTAVQESEALTKRVQSEQFKTYVDGLSPEERQRADVWDRLLRAADKAWNTNPNPGHWQTIAYEAELRRMGMLAPDAAVRDGPVRVRHLSPAEIAKRAEDKATPQLDAVGREIEDPGSEAALRQQAGANRKRAIKQVKDTAPANRARALADVGLTEKELKDAATGNLPRGYRAVRRETEDAVEYAVESGPKTAIVNEIKRKLRELAKRHPNVYHEVQAEWPGAFPVRAAAAATQAANGRPPRTAAATVEALEVAAEELPGQAAAMRQRVADIKAGMLGTLSDEAPIAPAGEKVRRDPHVGGSAEGVGVPPQPQGPSAAPPPVAAGGVESAPAAAAAPAQAGGAAAPPQAPPAAGAAAGGATIPPPPAQAVPGPTAGGGGLPPGPPPGGPPPRGVGPTPGPSGQQPPLTGRTNWTQWEKDYLAGADRVRAEVDPMYSAWMEKKAAHTWSGKVKGIRDVLAPIERHSDSTLRGMIEAENSLIAMQGYMAHEFELQMRPILNEIGGDWQPATFRNAADQQRLSGLEVVPGKGVVDEFDRVHLSVLIERPGWFDIDPALESKLSRLRDVWELQRELDRRFDLDYDRFVSDGGYLPHYWDGDWKPPDPLQTAGKPGFAQHRHFHDVIEGLEAGRHLLDERTGWLYQRSVFARGLARGRRQSELRLQQMRASGYFDDTPNPGKAVEQVLQALKRNDQEIRMGAFSANTSQVATAIRTMVYGMDPSFWLGTQGSRLFSQGPIGWLRGTHRAARVIANDPYYSEFLAMRRDDALTYMLAGGDLFSSFLEIKHADGAMLSGLTDNRAMNMVDRAVGRSSAVYKLMMFRTLDQLADMSANSTVARRALYALPWNWELFFRRKDFYNNRFERQSGIVAFIDHLFGGRRVSSKTGAHATAEAVIMATPHFVRSTVALVGAMGRRDYEGLIARRFALQFMAIATASVALMNAAFAATSGAGAAPSFSLINPTDKKNFLVVKTPWGNFTPFGTVTKTTETLIRSIYNPEEGGLVGPFFDPDEWETWLQARAGNMIGLPIQMISGNEWFAPDANLESPRDYASMVVRKSLPITLGGVLENVEAHFLDGQALSLQEMIFSTSLDFTGFGQASSYQSLADAQNEWAEDNYGRSWNELLRFTDGEAHQDEFYDSDAYADWEQQGEKFGDPENPGFVAPGSEDTAGRQDFLRWMLDSGQVDPNSAEGKDAIVELAEIRDAEIRAKIEADEPLVDADGQPYKPTDIASAKIDILRDETEAAAREAAAALGIELPAGELDAAIVYATPELGTELRRQVDELARMAVYQGTATPYQVKLVEFLDAVLARQNNNVDWRDLDSWGKKQLLAAHDDLRQMYEEMGETAQLGDVRAVAQEVYDKPLEELTVQERRDVEAIVAESDKFYLELDDAFVDLDNAIGDVLGNPEYVGPQVGEELDRVRAAHGDTVAGIYTNNPGVAEQNDIITALQAAGGDRGALYRQMIKDTRVTPFIENDPNTSEGMQAAMEQQHVWETLWAERLGESHPGLYDEFQEYADASKSDPEQMEAEARDYVTNHPLNPLEAENRVFEDGRAAAAIRASPKAAQLLSMFGIDIDNLQGMDDLRAQLVHRLGLQDLSKKAFEYYGAAGVAVYRLIQEIGDDGSVYERGTLLDLITDEKNAALDSDTKLDVLFNFYYSYDDVDISPRNENAAALTAQLTELQELARTEGPPDVDANRAAALHGQRTSGDDYVDGMNLIFTQEVAPRAPRGFDGPPSAKQAALLRDLGLGVPATMGEAVAILDGYFQQNPRGGGGSSGAWRGEPVSDRQRVVLEDLGLPVPETKGEASDALDAAFADDGGGGGEGASADWRDEPASGAQTQLMKDLGLEVPDGITKGEAADVLDEELGGGGSGGGGGDGRFADGSSLNSRFGVTSEREKIIMNTGLGALANREGIKSLAPPPKQRGNTDPELLTAQVKAFQRFKAAGMTDEQAQKAMAEVAGAPGKNYTATVNAILEQWALSKAKQPAAAMTGAAPAA